MAVVKTVYVDGQRREVVDTSDLLKLIDLKLFDVVVDSESYKKIETANNKRVTDLLNQQAQTFATNEAQRDAKVDTKVEGITELQSFTKHVKSIFKELVFSYDENRNNKYIDKVGNLLNLTNARITEPISIKAGETITIFGTYYSGNVAAISKCDENGENIVPVVICQGEAKNYSACYSYTFDADGYVIFCSLSQNIELYNLDLGVKEFDEINSIKESLYKEYSAEVEYEEDYGYISPNGNIIPFGSDDYRYSKPFYIKGGTVSLYLKGYQTNVSLLSSCNEYGSNIQPIIVSDSSYAKYYNATITDGYYRISTHKATLPHSITYKSNEIERLSNKTDNLHDEIKDIEEKIEQNGYLNLFNKIIFVGDSVTDGHVIDKSLGVSKVVRSLSYPTRLGQIHPHIEIKNQGHAGVSVQGWNNNRFVNEYDANKEGVDLCILELGWNQKDSYAWPLTMELFNSEFQTNVKAFGNNYQNYITENSVVGNYCQLVKKIYNSTPNVVLVCVASFGWPQLRADFVRILADWAGALFIDAHTNMPDGGDNVHFTPYGYFEKARKMNDYLNKLFKEERDYVKLRIYRNNGLISE